MPHPAVRPASRYALAALMGGLLVAAIGATRTDDSTVAACTAGAVSRVYLGQSTPAGTVGDTDWRGFIHDAVAPRFPDGFTELQGHGHWRDARGVALEESTRILEIAHDGSPAVHARVRGIAADYRVRFAQESVLITTTRADQCFEDRAALSTRRG